MRRTVGAAHLISKERLRFYGVPEEAIWDERVVRAICSRAHRALDARICSLTRDQIPSETEQYAAEVGMAWWLDRTYGIRMEEAA